MLRRLAEYCLLPPLSCLLLFLLGAVLRKARPRISAFLSSLGLLLLWALATPACAGLLLRTLQPFGPLPPEGPFPTAGAIVVLSAESDRIGAEYGGPVAGPMTMQRLRYAAHLHRATRLPLLCSGGRPEPGDPPLAELMKRALEREFRTEVRWTEDRSSDTFENAAFAAEILKREGISRILLVSSAWHLPRAVDCFERQGIEAIPAPTGFRGPAVRDLLSFVPQHAALRDSSLALHEWIGRLYYLLR